MDGEIVWMVRRGVWHGRCCGNDGAVRWVAGCNGCDGWRGGLVMAGCEMGPANGGMAVQVGVAIWVDCVNWVCGPAGLGRSVEELVHILEDTLENGAAVGAG